MKIHTKRDKSTFESSYIEKHTNGRLSQRTETEFSAIIIFCQKCIEFFYKFFKFFNVLKKFQFLKFQSFLHKTFCNHFELWNSVRRIIDSGIVRMPADSTSS